jgi:hypothetical protein
MTPLIVGGSLLVTIALIVLRAASTRTQAARPLYLLAAPIVAAMLGVGILLVGPVTWIAYSPENSVTATLPAAEPSPTIALANGFSPGNGVFPGGQFNGRGGPFGDAGSFGPPEGFEPPGGFGSFGPTGGSGGFGGGDASASAGGGTQVNGALLTAWVESHGTTVTAGGVTLYYVSSAAAG